MDNSAKVYPGDKISALGYTFTVWRILYQDHIDGTYDVEFTDDQGRYHHWKECYDGGTVIRSGQPGKYFRDDEITDVIAAILPARQPGTYSARIIERSGQETYLGRYSHIEAARIRLEQFAAPHGYTWREM